MSFTSGDDPMSPLSLDGVLGVSLGTGENSDLSCVKGLDFSLSLEEAVISS